MISLQPQDPAIQRFEDISYLVCQKPFAVFDLLRFVLGERIAVGQFRSVYEFTFRPNTVIKFTFDGEVNHTECAIWYAISKTKYKKWFAPIIEISPCGHFMLQQRTRPIKETDKLPKKVPNFFTDLKRENFGWIGKQLVCHDYQFLDRAMDIAFTVHMRNADWDSGTTSKPKIRKKK